jgi:hypothetical protein
MRQLAYGALAMAAAVRSGEVTGVTLHTDQGSEYTAGLFRRACDRLRIRQSIGRPGSALDNAVIESFHSTLEFELRSLEDFPTQAAARTRVAAWIDEYNTIRRHSAIAMIFPGRLGSHPERRAGSTNARARRAGNQGDGSAAHPGVRRAGYRSAPPGSRLLRIAHATALRAGPDPGDLCEPSGSRHGQAMPALSRARRTGAVSPDRKPLRFQGIATRCSTSCNQCDPSAVDRRKRYGVPSSKVRSCRGLTASSCNSGGAYVGCAGFRVFYFIVFADADCPGHRRRSDYRPRAHRAVGAPGDGEQRGDRAEPCS